jgi:hypothetical protein
MVYKSYLTAIRRTTEAVYGEQKTPQTARDTSMQVTIAIVTVVLVLLSQGAQSQATAPQPVKVASAEHWYEEADPPYVWRTDNTLLYWRRSSAKTLLVERNLATGRERFVHAAPNRADMGPAAPAVSPNGKWLFWLDTYAGDRNYLLAMPGDRKALLPRRIGSRIWGPDIVQWMPDSRHWLMLDWVTPQGKHMTSGPRKYWIGDAQSLSQVSAFWIAANSPLYTREASFATIKLISSTHLLTINSGDDSDPLQDHVLVYDLRINAAMRISRRFKVRLPFRARVEQAAFSPKGDRVAWLLGKSADDERHADEIWISKTDGSAMRRLARLPGRSTEQDIFYRDLQWLPSGRWVSYRLGDALWKVRTN